MDASSVHFLWQDELATAPFRTGVCLHGHTMHSEECLAFLPRYLHQAPGISQIVRRYERSHRGSLDFARAYWTPPLAPAAALSVEKEQIEKLGLHPLVSLTDHDSIEANVILQVTASRAEVPVSVEWTVPYDESILHLGIHNLPLRDERSWMTTMAAHTAAPNASRLPGLLASLSQIPDVLLVLNHPFWLEEGVEEAGHCRALDRFMRECLPWIHAFELNGTRSWSENESAVRLAHAHRRPIISGGDRHACEPSACINLTNARTFAEFVSEIKAGQSTVLFMPQYREPMALRILEAGRDILRHYPEYPERARWTDRVFYRGEDSVARSLSTLWKDRTPWMLSAAASAIHLFAANPLRSAVRLLLIDRGEVTP
jgi:hypothetical protein